MHDALRTQLVRGHPGWLEERRRARIEEAIAWGKGSPEEPAKHLVDTLPDGTEVYFLKPGREAGRRRPNPHDMTPVVGSPETRPTFLDTWSKLAGIGLRDPETLKAISVLVYRNAYMLDHEDTGGGRYRYRPSRGILECIEGLQSKEEVRRALPRYGLLGFLHFLDVLGWNEDVKYHVEGGRPTFEGRYKPGVGRINTLLSCIGATFPVLRALRESGLDERTDVRPLYDVMYRLSKSRGTVTPTRGELRDWLRPYVTT